MQEVFSKRVFHKDELLHEYYLLTYVDNLKNVANVINVSKTYI